MIKLFCCYLTFFSKVKGILFFNFPKSSFKQQLSNIWPAPNILSATNLIYYGVIKDFIKS